MPAVAMVAMVAMADMVDMVVTAMAVIFMAALAALVVGAGATLIITAPMTRILIAVGSAYGSGETDMWGIAASGAAGDVRTSDSGGGSLFPVSHVDKVSGDRGSRSHCRRYKMRSSLVSLTAFEVAV